MAGNQKAALLRAAFPVFFLPSDYHCIKPLELSYRLPCEYVSLTPEALGSTFWRAGQVDNEPVLADH